jgi:thiamine kinase-like enzyme
MEQPAQVLTHIDELSNDWLSKVLGKPIEAFSYQEIVGEGYASRMYRLNLTANESVPASLILKLATVQQSQIDLLDPEVFCREVEFYQGLGGELAESGMLPRVYFAAANKQLMQLTLLFEDLGEIPHKPWRANLDESLAAVEALAKVHAKYWQSDKLLEPAYAPVESELDLSELLAVLQENLDQEAAASYSFPYLRGCVQHVHKLARWLVGELDQFHGPMTLVHGDFHVRNIHFMPERVVIFDWQVTERGRPVRDLIYWLIMCVDVADSKAFKPKLIEAYLTALAKHGVVYKKLELLRDFNESLLQMVSRIYCFQTLITLSEQDQHELENFLQRADAMAQAHYIRAQLRIARVLAPPVVLLLRLLGKR